MYVEIAFCEYRQLKKERLQFWAAKFYSGKLIKVTCLKNLVEFSAILQIVSNLLRARKYLKTVVLSFVETYSRILLHDSNIISLAYNIPFQQLSLRVGVSMVWQWNSWCCWRLNNKVFLNCNIVCWYHIYVYTCESTWECECVCMYVCMWVCCNGTLDAVESVND